MIKERRRKPERTVEQQLPGSGLEQVFAANDFCDLHRGIVGHYRQVISRNIIVPPDDKIAEIGSSSELLRAATAIHKRDDFAIRHTEVYISASPSEANRHND